MKFLCKIFASICGIIILGAVALAQTERLTNSHIVEMTKVGLDPAIIILKIEQSEADFDLSANALIDLRRNGVDNTVIAKMTEKKPSDRVDKATPDQVGGFSENLPSPSVEPRTATSPSEALKAAKTVAIEKSSLNPSRQSLEKALMKRADWQKYKLTLVRYKEDADLYIEIGRVPFSWVTHRYVFRVYDRRTGTIVTAGETTSWGSLAENLAREITQKLALVGAQ